MAAPLMPESVTLDDLEKAAAPQPPKLEEIKLDGEGVPDDLKGKSVTELVKMAQGLSEALKTSERARLQSDQMAALATRQAPSPPPAPKEEPPLTDEQLAEMYQNDPIKAIRTMNEQAIRTAAKNLESRLGSLSASAASSAERDARAKFPAEFEVLGAEIQKMKDSIPNADQVLSTPDAWERLVSLVRGGPGAFEKIAGHYMTKGGFKTIETARSEQAADAGLSLNSSVRAPASSNSRELDATQKEIARNLGITDAEYLEWSKV